MKLACLFFSSDGEKLAQKLASSYADEVTLFSKKDYKAKLPQIFSEFEGVVFISSTGIAVRLSHPYIKNKTVDPAIVVVDDSGRYAISLLSGHLGGANALTTEIALLLSCQPIITTASDARGLEAVDLFAMRNNLEIGSLENAKKLTALMIEGKRIEYLSNYPFRIRYHNLVKHHPDGYLIVTCQERSDHRFPACYLHPRLLNVGIGCKKGKSSEEIIDAIQLVFKERNLSLNAINTIASVEVKKDEPGLIEACSQLNRPLKIFTTEEIRKVQDQFAKSEFVESIIGVTGVSEPCAHLAGGEIIIHKHAVDGVTVAVAKMSI